ncbi:hypothetical protein B0H19DRAFT_1248909 [Mycena capillaripes]|nr:hypothetical protein B0H19DRAFT_1248909 [Mycena capillaripes]
MEHLSTQTTRLGLTESSGTSFIQTLPPEIIAEIFVNFLPNYPEFPTHSGSLSPLILCRICRYWREIAISTPALWKAISIDIDETDNHDHEIEMLELLKTWITRSGNCPLSLSLTLRGPPETSSVFAHFIETAVAHCARWEHLNVLVPFDHMHRLTGDMPLLRGLTFGPTDLRYDVDFTLSLFERAPQLRRIVLTPCFLSANVSLPWAQLTHLDADCLYEHECIEILRAAPRLVACTLNVCCSDEDAVFVDTAIPAHPHLRNMALLVDDVDVRLWRVLACLTLPALCRLQIPEPCIRLESLTALVERSQCALEELCITRAMLDEPAFRDAVPTVGRISFEEVGDTNYLLADAE